MIGRGRFGRFGKFRQASGRRLEDAASWYCKSVTQRMTAQESRSPPLQLGHGPLCEHCRKQAMARVRDLEQLEIGSAIEGCNAYAYWP